MCVFFFFSFFFLIIYHALLKLVKWAKAKIESEIKVSNEKGRGKKPEKGLQIRKSKYRED